MVIKFSEVLRSSTYSQNMWVCLSMPSNLTVPSADTPNWDKHTHTHTAMYSQTALREANTELFLGSTSICAVSVFSYVLKIFIAKLSKNYLKKLSKNLISIGLGCQRSTKVKTFLKRCYLTRENPFAKKGNFNTHNALNMLPSPTCLLWISLSQIPPLL